MPKLSAAIDQATPDFAGSNQSTQSSQAPAGEQSARATPTQNSPTSPARPRPGSSTCSPFPSQQDVAATRHFDVVVFGASGSVGKFVVEELALVLDKRYNPAGSASAAHTSALLAAPRDQSAQTRRLSVPRQPDSIRWAVAGRSAVKLSETLCAAELSTGVHNLSTDVPVLLADLNHRKSLLDMCRKTGLVINCAGPYSVDGEPVIRACIESKTNYIDLAHEAAFIECMRQKYSDDAQKANVFIINGCGFQSMSAEMGLNFTKQVVDGQIDEVKIILNLSHTQALIRPSGSDSEPTSCGIVTYGMWKSLLLNRAFASRALKESGARQRALDKPKPVESHFRLLKRKDTHSLVTDLVAFKNRTTNSTISSLFRGLKQGGRRFCLPVGSLLSDESQLISAEMIDYQHKQHDPNNCAAGGWKPIRCSSFLSTKTFSQVLMLMVWMFIFNLVVIFAPFRALLYTFPSMGSLGHVCNAKVNRKLDRDALSHIKYCQTFVAYGTPGDDSGDPLEGREKHSKRKQEQLLVTRIVGPETNHIAAATFCVQAALAVMLERDHLPPGGGIFTPGSAFAETNIIYQLRKRNIKFEVLKKA